MLQIKTSGGTDFAASKAAMGACTGITAIYHVVREKEILSRIQIIIKPQISGQPLYENFLRYVSSNPAVSAWKVMNPDLGSNGPDSAVIYLNTSLHSPYVQELSQELVRNLGTQLEAPPIAPLGLLQIHPGIYGLEVPTKHLQTHALGIPKKNTGSAGAIMSALISTAAVSLHQTLLSNPSKLAEFKLGKIEYMKTHFKNSLTDSVGWTLTDN